MKVINIDPNPQPHLLSALSLGVLKEQSIKLEIMKPRGTNTTYE